MPGLADKAFDPTDYDTLLTTEQEKQFQDWLMKYVPENQRSTNDYDLRGFFLAGLNHTLPDNYDIFQIRNNGQHFIDTYKKPNHMTFSNQSIYNGIDARGNPTNYRGGMWIGNDIIGYTFIAHPSNLNNSQVLKEYWDKEEAPYGNKLIDPRLGNFY